jgi:hypothetical protein
VSAEDFGDSLIDGLRRAKLARDEKRLEKPVVMAEDRAEKAKRLREEMPEIAGLVDCFRAHGFDVQVLAAQENGRTVINREGCRRFGVDYSEYEQKG